MDHSAMEQLVSRHIRAEGAGDVDTAISVYTDDVEHDVVGSPTGPLHGTAAAQGFYEFLTSNITTQEMVPTHSYYGDDFCVIEHDWTGAVQGEFMGIPGNGRQISFRLLHIWEFREGKISRENVWLDGGAIVAQLSSPADH